jgi:hypothetical protein
MTAPSIRRAAERKAKKLARKSETVALSSSPRFAAAPHNSHVAYEPDAA